jgi:hypothetical protein
MPAFDRSLPARSYTLDIFSRRLIPKLFAFAQNCQAKPPPLLTALPLAISNIEQLDGLSVMIVFLGPHAMQTIVEK